MVVDVKCCLHFLDVWIPFVMRVWKSVVRAGSLSSIDWIVQVKQWGKLLGVFCTTARLEMDLMNKIQIHCYEDAKLMKLFPEIIRALYDQDVLAEDTVLNWFKKGSNSKGR